MSVRKNILLAASCIGIMAVTAPKEGAAVPAYARQVGMSCTACHFQRYPQLTPFGRAFKSNGYSQKGKQMTIEDTNLSLPTTLNASLVSKFRFQKTNGTDNADPLNMGELQVPDEAILYLGGRVGKNIGFQAEISLAGGANLTGFKMPFVFPVDKDYTVSVIPFITDAQGPAYGFELLSTGAVEYARPFEHLDETSAQQYLRSQDPNGNAATGLALVAFHKYGYLSYTPYVVGFTSTAPRQFMSYVRGVVIPEKIHNFDVAAGFQLWKGDSKTDTGAGPVLNTVDAWALDAQAQGKYGDYPLGVYLSYGSAAGSGTSVNIYNSEPNSRKAFAIATELGLVPSKFSVGLGYRIANSGLGGSDSENAFTLGGNYHVAKNVTFQLNHSFYSYGADAKAALAPGSGDQKTTFVMFSAF